MEVAARQPHWVHSYEWLQICNWKNFTTAKVGILFVIKKERERENTECKSKKIDITKTGLGWIKIQIKYPFTTNGISPDDSLLANTDYVLEVFVRGYILCWTFRPLKFVFCFRILVNIF